MDNIFEKLNRIEDKVDAISPSQNGTDITLDEQLRNKDPKVFDFIQNADRIFYYHGDKSELKRKNIKNKKNAIIIATIAFLAVAALSVFAFFINYILGIVATALGLILCVPFIIVAFTMQSRDYKIPYKKWFLNTYNYDYDDNDIVCKTAGRKWYIKLHHILTAVYLYLSGIAVMLFGLDKLGLYALLGYIVPFLGATILVSMINKREWYTYQLVFEKDDVKIPYALLKEFMTENDLK